MYKNNKCLAIIPARSGSKGIPNKNIVSINEKPLIEYTLDSALNSKYLDRIIVSTDSLEIARVCEQVDVNLKVPFLRPKELATDESKTIDVLLHVVNNLKLIGESYDYLILLQPTQPLRQSFHIDEAITRIVDSKSNSLVSVSKVKDNPVLIRTIGKDENLVKLLDVNSTIRRQEFPEYYKVNGAIYINKINDFFDSTLSLNDNELAYVMSEKYDLDIDEPIDLDILKIKLIELHNNYSHC